MTGDLTCVISNSYRNVLRNSFPLANVFDLIGKSGAGFIPFGPSVFIQLHKKENGVTNVMGVMHCVTENQFCQFQAEAWNQ